MRILLASFGPNNRHTGLGKWTYATAAALETLGHATTIWLADAFPTVARTGRFAFLVYPLALTARIWRCRAAFDIVVLHEPSGFWYGLLRRVQPSLPPMIAMCHNVESKVHRLMRRAAARGYARPTPWNRVTVPLLRLWQSDGAIRLADHVACLSSEDRDHILRELGCAPERVTWQPNGVIEEDFVPRPAPGTGRLALFVGGWLDVKGRRLLPSIWRAVRARCPDAQLTAVGTGPPPETVLADFAAEDRNSVTVVPSVTDPREMTALYTRHDLLLVPSITEGSPLTLLEAMAAGLPVVAARTGGIPDVVTHGQDGLLFEPLDPAAAAAEAVRLLEDPGLARRLGLAGQQRVRTLNWTASARVLAEAAERRLARHGAAMSDARA